MNIVGYKCKICSWETTKRGWKNESLNMNEHFEKHHPFEIKTINKSKNLVSKLTAEIEEKYLKTLSEYVESMPSKPSKKWKCPRCATEPMSYSSKLWHLDNFHNKIVAPKRMLGINDKQP